MKSETNQEINEKEQIHSNQSIPLPLPLPLPLSFPSILINPRLKHLSNLPSSSIKLNSSTHQSDYTNKKPHDPLIGRRRKRRFENAQFTSNPHVCRPGPSDYQLWNSNVQVRFPNPPPRGYPSSTSIRPVEPIPADPFSAAMGAFNRSLKGVRKSVRPLVSDHAESLTNPGPVEEMILKIDDQLSNWIDSRTIWKSTETDHSHKVIDSNPWPPPSEITHHHPISPSNLQPSIVEISRSPHMLSWDVPSPFGRYLVHCIARYYGIVSFSRQQSIIQPANDHQQSRTEERRIVCMIKAHFPTARGSRRFDGHQTLDTPPTTDLDSELSAVEVLSEVDSVPTTDDDHQISDPIHQPKQRLLSSIRERKEIDEHQLPTQKVVHPDENEPSEANVADVSDYDHSLAQSSSDDDELESRVGESQQHQRTIDNSDFNSTPLAINKSSDSFLAKMTPTPTKKNLNNIIAQQNLQSNQSPFFSSLRNTPTHQLQQNQNNISKARVLLTRGSEKPVNFLDWVRGY